MFVRIAALATARAHRTQSLADLKRAWFFRSLASWLRGGDWSPFDLGIALPKVEHPDRASRQSRPRAETVVEVG